MSYQFVLMRLKPFVTNNERIHWIPTTNVIYESSTMKSEASTDKRPRNDTGPGGAIENGEEEDLVRSEKRIKQTPDDELPQEPTNSDDISKKKLSWSDENVPNTAHYHISWMHADCVSHVVHNAKHGYVVSGRSVITRSAFKTFLCHCCIHVSHFVFSTVRMEL